MKPSICWKVIRKCFIEINCDFSACKHLFSFQFYSRHELNREVVSARHNESWLLFRLATMRKIGSLPLKNEVSTTLIQPQRPGTQGDFFFQKNVPNEKKQNLTYLFTHKLWPYAKNKMDEGIGQGDVFLTPSLPLLLENTSRGIPHRYLRGRL